MKSSGFMDWKKTQYTCVQNKSTPRAVLLRGLAGNRESRGCGEQLRLAIVRVYCCWELKDVTDSPINIIWFVKTGLKRPGRLLQKALATLGRKTGNLIFSVIYPEKFVYYNATRNDRWIAEHIYPGKTNGYFLEVGAAGGREASSCYTLETELGWTGICVEPNDNFFKQLVQHRTHSICENVCLAGKSGRVVYIEGNDDTVSSYLGGIKSNLEAIKYGGRDVIEKGKEVEKNAITLEELLKKHNASPVIDYAAFDIEGSELEVLEGFPFDQYTFLALTLECDGSIWEPITKLLTGNGYKEVKNPFNRDKFWERYWLHKSIA